MSAQPEVNSIEPKIPETTPVEQAATKQPTTDPVKPVEENQEQINWRKFRQEREKERKAKEESDRKAAEKTAEAAALKAALESLVNKPNTSVSHAYTEEVEETEDQRLERKVRDALQKEEKIRETERQKREVAELPKKLAATFNDFNQVCTQENLDYLEYHYPEVAAGFKHAPENFETWTNFYKALKRFVPNTDSKKDMAKMEKNLAKPQSMSLPGVSQTGDQAPAQLNDQRRKDNWNRMQRTMKGLK